MRKISYRFVHTVALSLIAAGLAAAQSDTPKISQAAGSAAETTARPKPDSPSLNTADKSDNDKPKEAAAVPPKPAPVKYTELKKTAWPPRNGVKTPGVQIPITSLKPEAEIPLPAAAGSFVFTADQVLISIPSADQ